MVPTQILTTYQSASTGDQALIAVGLLLLLFALFNMVRTLRLKRSAGRMSLIEGRVEALGTTEFAQTSDSLVRRAETRVDVRYTVSGKTYRCRRYALFGGNLQYGAVRHAHVAPGETVMVRYDRERPRVSALVVDAPPRFLILGGGVFGPLVAGLLFVALPAGRLFFGG